jgi:hypothetical protein
VAHVSFSQHDLAAHLPAPRPDEPPELRRDIVDEIADHLTCATRREQLSGRVDETEAHRRAIDRFGDPVRLARKLWFDALWEKIMSQRLLIAMCAATVLISAAALGLAWSTLNRQSDLIEGWKESTEKQLAEQRAFFKQMADDSRTATAALAARVDQSAAAQASAQAAAAKAPSDWNPVEYHFRSGSKQGPPVPGVKVRLSITASETGIPALEAISDEAGIVRFERVRYGTYYVHFTTPTGDVSGLNLTLQLGQSLTETIACPTATATLSNVKVRIHWPEELQKEALSLRANRRDVFQHVDGTNWGQLNDVSSKNASSRLIGPEGNASIYHSNVLKIPPTPEHAQIEQSSSTPYRSSASEDDHDLFPWQGQAYVLRNASVMKRLQFPDAPPFSGRSPRPEIPRFFGAVAVDCTAWKYEWEDGEPKTLWLTPTPEDVDKVKLALTELAHWEQASKERMEQARIRRDEARAKAAREAESQQQGNPPQPPGEN